MGVCVALRGPGAGLKRAGPRIGIWMKVVPGGCRRRGLAATVERVGGVKAVWRKLAVRFLANCFCRASLVWEREKRRRETEWIIMIPQSYFWWCSGTFLASTQKNSWWNNFNSEMASKNWNGIIFLKMSLIIYISNFKSYSVAQWFSSFLTVRPPVFKDPSILAIFLFCISNISSVIMPISIKRKPHKLRACMWDPHYVQQRKLLVIAAK